jgi:hypothetical protein
MAAAAATLAGAVLVHLAWTEFPMQSGLAVGHAVLAAVWAVHASMHALRLERQNAALYDAANVHGPALLGLAVILWTDATHAALIGFRDLDAFAVVLPAGVAAAVLLTLAVELALPARSRPATAGTS